MIQIHNTLTGKLQDFEPAQPGLVRMYVCGVTPYDVCHLGHGRCYVVFDVIRRVLRDNGYKVRFIQNFTDVDDKIIMRAHEKGITTTELVKANIEDYFNKMDALGVERADAYPRVTENIPDIIALIRKIMDKKAAYRLGGDVYFSVRQDPDYGKLSKRPLDELQSGARIDVNKEKKDPLDFALWKEAKPNEPPEAAWDSPWSRGRPGWHIECSVMSLKHLGSDFDIHGGGLDLIFPHHENEIAQSETATGAPFVRFWMHNGFVTLNREKMSKSAGNFFTLSEIFAKYHPSVVRYMLLSVHYRSPLDFSPDLLDQSRQSLAKLKDAVARATFVMRKQGGAVDSSGKTDSDVALAARTILNDFREALANDFNTPGALAEVHRLVGLLEKQFLSNTIQAQDIRMLLSHLRTMAEVLGLDLFPRTGDVLIPSAVSELAREREAARQQKNWKEADRLRQAILEQGYVVEDTASGPRLLPKAGS
ncbi:MAG TPA: cysteine--tRNA ligase [Elusimicrobiota bacterium]|nr:cysteine--tRNA ligase [Elusimicrobiota bacterium]